MGHTQYFTIVCFYTLFTRILFYYMPESGNFESMPFGLEPGITKKQGLLFRNNYQFVIIKIDDNAMISTVVTL